MADELKDVLTQRTAQRTEAPQLTPAVLNALQSFYKDKSQSTRFDDMLRQQPSTATDFARKVGLPNLPPQPARFQKDVPVAASPEVAKAARTLLDLDPKTKSQVSKITHGPTSGSMRLMTSAGISPEKFEGSSLLGTYGLDTNEIGIQPGRGDWMSTLIHEIAHASGRGEAGADQAEVVAAEAQKIKP